MSREVDASKPLSELSADDKRYLIDRGLWGDRSVKEARRLLGSDRLEGRTDDAPTSEPEPAEPARTSPRATESADDELEAMDYPQLQKAAKERGLKYVGISRDDLIASLKAPPPDPGEVPAEGEGDATEEQQAPPAEGEGSS